MTTRFLADQLKAAISRSQVARQQEIDHAAAFKQAQQRMRDDGRCDAIHLERPRGQIGNYFQSVCGKPEVPGKGKCRQHYLRYVLHVSNTGNAGGKDFRPFKAWQVPLRDMSETQEKLLADRKRLPLETSYEDCLQSLNAVDPSHPLLPIYEPPLKTPRKSSRG